MYKSGAKFSRQKELKRIIQERDCLDTQKVSNFVDI